MTLSAGRKMLLAREAEVDLRDQVRLWAERAGWVVYFTWNSYHSPAGFPDLVMVRPPRLIIAELKTQKAPAPKGRQALWLMLLAQVPCIEVHLWRPWDEDEILAALA